MALLMTVVALTVSTLLATTAYRVEAKSRQDAEEAEQQAAKQRHIAEGERDAAEHFLYCADMQLSQQAWETANIKRLRELLEIHRPELNQRDLRGWEWRYLRAHCHRDLFTLVCRPREDGSPAMNWSPDGRRLAAAVDDEKEAVVPGRGAISRNWTPARTIKVWDATTGQELLTLRGHANEVSSLAWSPESKRVASTSLDGKIKVWDVANGGELLTLRGHPNMLSLLAWSPDGQWLASAGSDGTVRVWDATKAKELLTLRHGTLQRVPPTLRHGTLQSGGILYSLRWSPDGKRLALAGDGQVIAWDSVTGQQVFAVPISTSYGRMSWRYGSR